MSFEINLIFLIKPFFYQTRKSRKKLNILRTKELLQSRRVRGSRRGMPAFSTAKVFFLCIIGKQNFYT